MKRIIITLTIILGIIGLGYVKPVFALTIETPRITGVEYPTATSVKIKYNTYTTNTSYNVQIYNTTTAKYYKNTIPSDSYVIEGLETGKTYNIIIRVYYQTTVSEWSNVMSVTPKAGPPVINSITAGDKKLVLNYSTSGSPTGIEILNLNTMKSTKVANLTTATIGSLTNGTTYNFMIRNYYTNKSPGPWSAQKSGTPNAAPAPAPAPAPSTPTNSAVEKAKKYSSIKVLRTYNTNNMKRLATISEGSGMVPQSFCDTGSKYVVQFVKYPSDAYGKLVAYNKGGSVSKRGSQYSVGHGNGLTYSNATGKIYSVRGNKTCIVFNSSSLKKEKSFSLPKEASGIAYDSLTKQYYLGKAGKIHVLNSNFGFVKTISKKRTLTAQDIGAYQGVALVIAWYKNTSKNYIDLYRISDGAYIGSYYLPMNEVESVFVDDGYLVIIRNIQGTNKDYLYKSKSRISFP